LEQRRRVIKRVFDLVIAGTALLLLSPVFLILALAIKLTSKGPVFYRGERAGLNGRLFRICKFRTLVVDAEARGISPVSDRDPRITPMGARLRKYKLDELPQLINVFVGDMSLVGPRPEVKQFVDLYTEEEKAILTVRPGITDWASLRFHDQEQIIAASGIADPTEAYLKLIRPEKLRLQLQYVRERSFGVDVRLLFLTAGRLLSSRFGSGKAKGNPVSPSQAKA
jgi:lipopolysaccharide/colanic/teichoic acid biosynthesis glycosyltransferase